MSSLRLPLFVLALYLLLLVFLVELGARSATSVANQLPLWLRGGPPTQPAAQVLDLLPPDKREELATLQEERADDLAELQEEIEGFGVNSLAFVDATLLFTLALMAVGILIPKNVHARLQGCVTVIFAILLILATLVATFLALGKLIVMVSLFLSFPFGTLAYLVIYGSFPRGAAAAVLSLLFLLKMVLVVVLVLAHPRFLENKGLVLFVAVSFLATFVVVFLHNLVPGILVSITDAVAAIVVGIVAIILAVIMVVGGLFSVLLALKPL